MPIIIHIFLLICLVSLSGCRCHRASELPEGKAPEKGELRDSELPPQEAPEKRAPSMIKVESLAAEEKVLVLDYQVTNPFSYDIWVCEDIDIELGCPVEIRIDAETVYIRLTYRLESNMLRNPPAYGRYRRLLSGESHSAKIRLDLPVRNISPVYYFKERGKNLKSVVMHRAVFVIGYIEGGHINRLRGVSRTLKRGFDEITLYEVQKSEPIIAEETQHGQTREMLYVTCGAGAMERCTEVVITDVNIPCTVLVDDK